MSIFNALLRPVSKMEIEERKAEAVVAAQETENEEIFTVGEKSESSFITTHPEASEDVVTVANYFKAKEIAIDLRQLSDGEYFEDHYVDIVKSFNMPVEVED
jgi:hypothetical protein